MKLPNDKDQMQEILKDDHKKSLQDLEEIAKLSEEVKADLEKNGSTVLSLSSLKKVEEIEKLAKRIRSRMRRM